MLGRWVGVDDQLDVVDVDAAGRDVGGHQGADRPGVEGLEVPGAGILGQVAVQVDRGHAQLQQLLGELLGAVLGAGEDDGLAGGCGQIGQDAHAVGLLDPDHVVVHLLDRRLGRVGLVGHRLVQVRLHEDADALVERGGEQHPLPLGRGLVEDAADHGQEAHVGHVVGLVDDGDRDGTQVDGALAHQIEESAGARDQHVDALGHGPDLGVLVDPTEDGEVAEPGDLGQRDEGLLELGGELAGGGEDQRAGALGCSGAAVGEPGHHGQQERERLPRPGAPAAEDVTSGQRVGQRGRLDRGGDGDAARFKGGDQGSGHAEAREV